MLLFAGGELVVHLELHAHLVHALWAVRVGVHVVFGGFASELGTDVVQVGERHVCEDVRLEVVDHAIEHMSGDLHVLSVEAGLRIDVDAELLPVLANNVKYYMVLRHKVVLFTGEGNDTIVKVLRGAISVLLNVAVGGNLIGLVDAQLRTRLLVGHDGQKVAVAIGVLGSGFGSKVGFGRSVEPSLVVLDGRLFLGSIVKVERKGDGLGAVRVDGFDCNGSENTLGHILIARSLEDIGSVGKLHNNTVLELLGSCVGLEDDTSSKRIAG